MWSDGTTMWVADHVDVKVYAYTIATKARDTTEGMSTCTLHNGDSASGLSGPNGTTVWVADMLGR